MDPCGTPHSRFQGRCRIYCSNCHSLQSPVCAIVHPFMLLCTHMGMHVPVCTQVMHTCNALVDLNIVSCVAVYVKDHTTHLYVKHFLYFKGLLIGIPVLRNLDEKWWEKIVWWVALVAYLACVLFAVFWNAFYKGFPETDWSPCCPAPGT